MFDMLNSKEIQNIQVDVYNNLVTIYFDINDDLEIVKSSNISTSLVRFHPIGLETSFPEILFKLIRSMNNPKFVFDSDWNCIILQSLFTKRFILMGDNKNLAISKILRRSKKIKFDKIKYIKKWCLNHLD